MSCSRPTTVCCATLPTVLRHNTVFVCDRVGRRRGSTPTVAPRVATAVVSSVATDDHTPSTIDDAGLTPYVSDFSCNGPRKITGSSDDSSPGGHRLNFGVHYRQCSAVTATWRVLQGTPLTVSRLTSPRRSRSLGRLQPVDNHHQLTERLRRRFRRFKLKRRIRRLSS